MRILSGRRSSAYQLAENRRRRDRLNLFVRPFLFPSTERMFDHGASPSSIAASIYTRWREARYDASESAVEELCALHPEHADRLRAIHRQFAKVGELLSLDSGAGEGLGRTEVERVAFAEVLARLRRHQPPESRYNDVEKVDSGGMGQILEVFDVDLRRYVAKKVMLQAHSAQPERTPSHTALLGRFLEEAQVAAQLAHPGLVPVHELGIDEHGQVFYTMDLVVGMTFHDVIQQVRAGDEKWTLARAVGDLVRVCETVAYAHSRGVLHRDLKPGNVMVGSFGEVYVIDWGLAKIHGRHRAPATEAKPASQREARKHGPVRSDRREESNRDSVEGLRTGIGEAPGTPGYMSPEQSLGDVDSLDDRTDVYSLGAILYHLLTGRRPFEAELSRKRLDAWAEALHERGPVPIEEVDDGAPPELISISKRAMERRITSRYASATEMAEDLRRWLEGRVVEAHESGAWAELRKWVQRNRGLAVSLGVAVVAVLLGAGGFGWSQKQRRVEVERKQILARVSSGPTMLAGLQAATEQLWPSNSKNVPALERWFAQKGELVALRPQFAAALAALNGDASAFRRDEIDPGLAEPLGALVRRIDEGSLPSSWMHTRLDMARSVDEITQTSDSAQARWRAAAQAITGSPKYGGLKLGPQKGLLPLREDPRSGLWEFWHALSGEEPRLDPQLDRWIVEPATGIVLVLIPEIRTTIGSPDVEPQDPRFDFLSDWNNSNPPTHQVKLTPYFISKYEMTQAQWRRARNVNPSVGKRGPETHPVESVSWDDCVETLRRIELTLPTEAQWEVAARGGAETIFYTGRDPASLAGHVVLEPDLDMNNETTSKEEESFGMKLPKVHQPVDGRLPNQFGLHDVHGNVQEWCLDAFDETGAPRHGDGLRSPKKADDAVRVMRGGGWKGGPQNARLAYRFTWQRQNREPDTGVRPARPVE